MKRGELGAALNRVTTNSDKLKQARSDLWDEASQITFSTSRDISRSSQLARKHRSINKMSTNGAKSSFKCPCCPSDVDISRCRQLHFWNEAKNVNVFCVLFWWTFMYQKKNPGKFWTSHKTVFVLLLVCSTF